MAWQITALSTVTKILSFGGEDFFPLLASFPTFPLFKGSHILLSTAKLHLQGVGKRRGEPFSGRLSVGKGKLMGRIAPGQHHCWLLSPADSSRHSCTG